MSVLDTCEVTFATLTEDERSPSVRNRQSTLKSVSLCILEFGVPASVDQTESRFEDRYSAFDVLPNVV